MDDPTAGPADSTRAEPRDPRLPLIGYAAPRFSYREQRPFGPASADPEFDYPIG